MRKRSLRLGPVEIYLGKISSHHHFAKLGEKWTSPWTPSQPHPVRWQIVRADGASNHIRPLIWILWLYPKDGSAIYVEFGFRRRAAAQTS